VNKWTGERESKGKMKSSELKIITMEYYFSKKVTASFEEAVSRTTEALKAQGFGVISDIDMSAKFKEKLGVDFKKYRILGACSPSHAYKAVQAEEKIGTMLPCNVLVIDQQNGEIEVSAVNPIASMMAIENPDLGSVAMEVTERLTRVIASL
jgi:uncharacterized protein (DUF302 family)